MTKVQVKVFIESEDYDKIEKQLREEKNKYRYGGSWSAAGRRAFYLLLLEMEGRIEIKDKKKDIARPY